MYTKPQLALCGLSIVFVPAFHTSYVCYCTRSEGAAAASNTCSRWARARAHVVRFCTDLKEIRSVRYDAVPSHCQLSSRARLGHAVLRFSFDSEGESKRHQ